MSNNPGNIQLETSDLIKVRSDIENYLIAEALTFSDQMESANREELRNISKQLRLEYPKYDEAQISTLIEKIKDHPIEKSLYDRRVYLTLSIIFGTNNMFDESVYYRDMAKKIPLMYYIDENDDNVQGPDETRNLDRHHITFGR